MTKREDSFSHYAKMPFSLFAFRFCRQISQIQKNNSSIVKKVFLNVNFFEKYLHSPIFYDIIIQKATRILYLNQEISHNMI